MGDIGDILMFFLEILPPIIFVIVMIVVVVFTI